MTTLYRKWRPQTFSEVYGQERVVRTLQNALAAGRVGHAYLFCGPRGTGKTTTARLLAKAVNCLHDDGASVAGGIPIEPDNTCSICRQIADGRSLDVVEIDAASNGRVDDARDLRDQINFAPNEARYKVYIIDEAHQITKDAFDALLKTFEEPPPHVIFVLATTDPNKVPPTILSRCQRLDFRRHTVAGILADLARVCAAEDIEAEAGALEVIARAADGSGRDSLSLLDQAIAFSGQQLTVEGARGMLGLASATTIDGLCAALLAGDAAAGLELINQAADAGVDPRALNRELVERLRALLLLKVSAGTAATLDVPAENLPGLREQAASLSAPVLVRQIKLLSEADFGFRSALQAQLPLELAFLQAVDAGRGAPAEEPAPIPRPTPATRPPFSFGTGAPSKPSPTAVGEGRVRAPAEALEPMSEETRPLPEGEGNALTQLSPAAAGDGSKEAPTAEPAAAGVVRDGAAATEYEAPVAGEPSLELFTAEWRRVREAVRQQKRNVEALLNSCAPTAFDGTTLTLVCDAQFHANELSKPENKRLVEGALSHVAGRPCYVKCEVREKKTEAPSVVMPGQPETARPDENDPLVRAALRMLNAGRVGNS